MKSSIKGTATKGYVKSNNSKGGFVTTPMNMGGKMKKGGK